MSSSLRTAYAILASLRLADVLDILVVAGMFYAAIRWFRSARSKLVMSGVATVLGLYFAARILEMRLTIALLQAAVTVAAVAMVVIFQDEIRRGFERMALGSRLGRKAIRAPKGSLLSVLVEASAHMAKNRVGALIVLRGKEPLDRHLTGGIKLNGSVSEPLIYSVFDHHSPGHDGALVIEGELATLFAAHLPLSTHIDGSERFGTRHTAAIGLSERSDAFCIVVSEERGQISVAEAGVLTPLSSSSELARRLAEFDRRLAPASPKGWLRSFLTVNIGTKGVSVALAVAAWVVAIGLTGDSAVRTLRAPIIFRSVPPGWLVEGTSPREVNVVMQGPKRPLEAVGPSDIALVIELADLEEGKQRHAIGVSDLEHPDGLVPQLVEPDTVSFSAHHTVEVSYRVKAEFEGKLGAGLKVGKVDVKPNQVDLIVKRSARATPRVVRTRPIQLSELGGSGTVESELVLPKDARIREGQPSVVRVQIEVLTDDRRH